MPDELMPADVPAAIRTIQDRLGLSHREIGERIGTPRPTVTRWALGTHPPLAIYRRALAKLLREAMRKPTPEDTP